MSILEDLVALDLAGLKREHEYLTAVRDWAVANLGIDYETGDRVEIVSEKPSLSTDGWKIYAEALAVGQTGIAGEIAFNSYGNRWDVLVGMDRSWSTHHNDWQSRTTRYWNGPADEAPEGFTLPGGYPPEGKVKHFFMPVSWVRKATS
jgi:hypothetical protein